MMSDSIMKQSCLETANAWIHSVNKRVFTTSLLQSGNKHPVVIWSRFFFQFTSAAPEPERRQRTARSMQPEQPPRRERHRCKPAAQCFRGRYARTLRHPQRRRRPGQQRHKRPAPQHRPVRPASGQPWPKRRQRRWWRTGTPDGKGERFSLEWFSRSRFRSNTYNLEHFDWIWFWVVCVGEERQMLLWMR